MSSNYKTIDSFYYDPEKPIGKGAFGVVYKAINQKTNKVVAVKVISASSLKQKSAYRSLLREINVLNDIKNENVVRLRDIKRTENNLYIFMDYCDGGDLTARMKSKGVFTEEEACSIIKQLVQTFIAIGKSCKDRNTQKSCFLMHRDIKDHNILFHQGKVRLIDFGLSQLIRTEEKYVKKDYGRVGTPRYMAPQLLNSESYSIKCDIWSLGMLFYQLLYGKFPWMGESVYRLYDNIKHNPLKFPTEPSSISDDTKDLITNMLQFEEEKRFSWEEVSEHSALTDIEIKPLKD